MHWKGAATLGLTVTLAAGGCGGSKPLTKAEFVKQAEAACVRSHAQQVSMLKAAAADEQAQHLSEVQARAKLIPKITAVEHRQLEQLASLKPPDELQSTFVQWRQALGVELAYGVHAATQTPAQHAQMMSAADRRQRLQGKLGVRRC